GPGKGKTTAAFGLALRMLGYGRRVGVVQFIKGGWQTGERDAFAAFGEQTNRMIRAELLDEGLEILTGLWKGQPFAYQGKHYRVQPTDFAVPPPPLQRPRIPIWVVGLWPREKSMRRVLRYDGLLPSAVGTDGSTGQASPEQVAEMAGYIAAHRELDTPFDIVVEGVTPGDDPAADAAKVETWRQAGATWWIESMWDAQGEGALERLAERVRKGPPG
nr:LLM class flavin-dependent oxidoreductase [Anaerolinea sp.]